MLRLELGPRPWIVGHRGALPEVENTIPSFLRAAAEGADAVECDVQETADGRLVVFHDETLERLAGDPAPVAERTQAELAAARIGPARASRIPTLEALLAALPPALPVNVEVKSYRPWRETLVDALLGALAAHDRFFVSSFDRTLLGHLRAAAPELALAALAERLDDDLLDFAAALDAVAIHVGGSPAAGAIARAGRPVLVYTVNEPAIARELLDRGVAGIFTDRPGALRRALDSGPSRLGLAG